MAELPLAYPNGTHFMEIWHILLNNTRLLITGKRAKEKIHKTQVDAYACLGKEIRRKVEQNEKAN